MSIYPYLNSGSGLLRRHIHCSATMLRRLTHTFVSTISDSVWFLSSYCLFVSYSRLLTILYISYIYLLITIALCIYIYICRSGRKNVMVQFWRSHLVGLVVGAMENVEEGEVEEAIFLD